MKPNNRLYLAAGLTALAAVLAYLIMTKGQDADEVIQAKYKMGTLPQDFHLDKRSVVIDFSYSEGSGVPLVLGIHGYRRPSRPLQKGERLIVVEESADVVAFLYFCADGRLCFAEARGS
jgi:hypothetical protein